MFRIFTFLFFLCSCCALKAEEALPSEEEALFFRRILKLWCDQDENCTKNQIELFQTTFPNSPFSDHCHEILGDIAFLENTGNQFFLSSSLDNPSDKELGAIAGSEHFDVEVEYAPKQSRPGYVFKITFQPKSDILFKRIRQNYFFLLDRSNSIPRLRYLLNKQVVSRALAFLKPGDTFNLLLFDDHVLRLAENNLPWTDENVAKAREFLDKHGHGGFFAATELYASLGKIIPDNVSDDEVNTAILLSDGDTFLSLEKQRKMIGGWTQHNHGKVSLFCVASGTGNNLPLLDLISAFNKGFLVYTSDHRLLDERLNRLIYSIRTPIGKKIAAAAIPSDKQMTILLRPQNSRLPNLYRDKPFVIYGSTNRLSDFVIFLQGQYYDRCFDIKKHISFKEAKRGTFSLERNWTQLVAQDFYEHFFQDGNIAHLEAAKQLLAPLHQSIPLMSYPE